tara:strand:+ start:15 stop:959 length:945 start_codon:yes stop_codon:yes gene_type:complete
MVETVNIPADRISLLSAWDRPGVTDPSKIVVGDPYIKFTAKDGKDYYTRNFSHSELIPKEKIKYRSLNEFQRSSGQTFLMPIMEKSAVDTGKLVGYINGMIMTDQEDGKNKLMVNKIEITNNPTNDKFQTKYGATFAEGKKDQGLKTNIGRNIMTQVISKLPFIESIGGLRISGARAVAADQRVKEGQRGDRYKSADTKVGGNLINRIKQNLFKAGVIDGFFTKLDLTKEQIDGWMKKNNTAVTGVALSGNDPMQDLGIKGMGNAMDDPSNFYLKMAEGGFVDGDEFADMIDFVMENNTPRGNLMNINQLTRPL